MYHCECFRDEKALYKCSLFNFNQATTLLQQRFHQQVLTEENDGLGTGFRQSRHTGSNDVSIRSQFADDFQWPIPTFPPGWHYEGQPATEQFFISHHSPLKIKELPLTKVHPETGHACVHVCGICVATDLISAWRAAISSLSLLASFNMFRRSSFIRRQNSAAAIPQMCRSIITAVSLHMVKVVLTVIT